MALSESDLGTMTTVIIQSFLEFHDSHPRFWRLLSWENLNGGKSFTKNDWSKIRNEYIDHIKQLYILGQEKGVFRPDVDFATYLLLIFSFTFFYFSNQLTISNLLDVKLSRAEIRHRIEEQLQLILTKGIHS
jgi:hypothetical protein